MEGRKKDMNEGWEGKERHRGERKREGKERPEDQQHQHHLGIC